MKALFPFLLVILAVVACSDSRPVLNKEPVEEICEPLESIAVKDSIPAVTIDSFFQHTKDFPLIKDSALFMKDLREGFNLEVDISPVQERDERITVYKKVAIYGSAKDYYLIEYDWATGCTAAYPWKHQILLTKEGKLTAILMAQRFDFVSVFPWEKPFLLAVFVTGRGNGSHSLFKISGDTLLNVLDNEYRTYDAHEDRHVFEPAELKLRVQDENKDGFNDLLFSGKQIWLAAKTPQGHYYDAETVNGKSIPFSRENPAKVNRVKFVFLYDKKSRRFKAKEKYDDEDGGP